MKPPKRIYKFESISTQSLRNLKNAQVFFSTPRDFNDPFDCAVVEESVSYSKRDVVALYNQYVSERKSKLPRVKKYSDIHPALIKSIEGSVSKVINEKQEEYLSNIGCSCFSETNKDILMWSHYANGHSGFCLEFDTSKAPFSKAMKVFYGKDFPKWNPLKLIFGEDAKELENEALLPLVRKYQTWRYEREWRVFHREPNKLYGYEVSALTGVYFGLTTNMADIEMICLILLGQNPNIMLYRAVKNESSYSVRFEEFIYTPHLDIISAPQSGD